MSNVNDPRKISDVLLSIEDKLITLIRTFNTQDMNNKLILDRLNKLLGQSNGVIESLAREEKKTATSVVPVFEISDKAIMSRKQASSPRKETVPRDKKNVGSKIPVTQRITDNSGKDIFMANVVITDLSSKEEIHKSQTNISGKWHANLPVGKYVVFVSKVVDPKTMHKIELNQEIEVSPTMKSLQLPVAIIQR